MAKIVRARQQQYAKATKMGSRYESRGLHKIAIMSRQKMPVKKQIGQIAVWWKWEFLLRTRHSTVII